MSMGLMDGGCAWDVVRGSVRRAALGIRGRRNGCRLMPGLARPSGVLGRVTRRDVPPTRQRGVAAAGFGS